MIDLLSGYSSLFREWLRHHIEISVISNNVEIKVNDGVLANVVDNNMDSIWWGWFREAIWES